MKRMLAMLLVMLILSAAFCVLTSCKKEEDAPLSSPSAKIDVLKIGKADCIIIDTGSSVIMIDTGEEENLPEIKSYMEEKQYTKIDALILTHYDKDHIGGAADIISSYEVSAVYESKFTVNDIMYDAYHRAFNEQGKEVTKLSDNTTLGFDGCELEIDVPKASSYAKKQSNNSSLVVSLTCGESKLLFCADALELRLNELINAQISQYDVVKLPHHGTYVENYPEFLDTVKPAYCIVTDSKKNPIEVDTLAALVEREITTYETRYGTVSIDVNESGITITQ